MDSHRFSLFGLTLSTSEDFSHSLQLVSSENASPQLTVKGLASRANLTSSEKLVLIVQRQQQAPDLDNSEQIFPPQHVSSSDPASLYIYKSGNTIRVVYLDFAVYDIIGEKIFCYPGPQTNTKQLHLNFLGPIMAMWLEQNGFQVLHACAVLINHKAVLFLADSQQGKSTIASTLANKGFPLLSDDLVPVKFNRQENQFYAYPAYPVIKLWPAHFNRLFKGHDSALYLDKDLKKCRVRVDSLNSSLFFNRPVPISLIYHLQRCDQIEHFSARPLANVDAMTKLIRYSFAAPIMIAMQWQPQRLKSFSRLCSTDKKMRELSYPSDINKLDWLSEKILTDFYANS